MVGPLEPFAIVRAIAVVRAFSRSLDEAARADRTSAPQHTCREREGVTAPEHGPLAVVRDRR